MISEFQIITALVIALVSGIFALSLGISLYS